MSDEWQWVPREPTEDMLDAGASHFIQTTATTYRAMLAAAPPRMPSEPSKAEPMPSEEEVARIIDDALTSVEISGPTLRRIARAVLALFAGQGAPKIEPPKLRDIDNALARWRNARIAIGFTKPLTPECEAAFRELGAAEDALSKLAFFAHAGEAPGPSHGMTADPHGGEFRPEPPSSRRGEPAPATIDKAEVLARRLDAQRLEFDGDYSIFGQAAIELRRLAAAAPAWREIASAPRDGHEVLIYTALGVRHIGRWGMRYVGDPGPESWVHEGKTIARPTHWQPLPAPPEQEPSSK